MNCKNCGGVINEGEIYCGLCGTKIENVKIFDTHSSLDESSGILNEEEEKEEKILIDAYIGKKASEFKKQNFSINTFFLGPLYVLYRKMYLLGAIWITIILFLVNYLPIFLIILLGVKIYISIKFKSMYLEHAREKVKGIKILNKDKTKEEIINMCKKSGGVNITIVIICCIINLISIILLTMFIIYYVQNSDKTNNNLVNRDIVSTAYISTLYR